MNLLKLKSLIDEAELPYFPRIPTPICAYSIIPTSFPPSPIAKTTKFILSLTNLTIKAFSFGELLQNITDLALESNLQYILIF